MSAEPLNGAARAGCPDCGRWPWSLEGSHTAECPQGEVIAQQRKRRNAARRVLAIFRQAGMGIAIERDPGGSWREATGEEVEIVVEQYARQGEGEG